MFFSVIPSPSKTWPKCPLQFEQHISTLFIPSELSGFLIMDPFISLSKEGHPHVDLNFDLDLNSGLLHALHIYNPLSKWLL